MELAGAVDVLRDPIRSADRRWAEWVMWWIYQLDLALLDVAAPFGTPSSGWC